MRTTLSLREAYDEDLSTLVRLLNVLRDHESEYDFPVAFLTNTMYVVSKNNLNGLINWDTFNSLILQKISYIHLEGISQTAFALHQAEVYDQAVWTALGDAVLAKDTLLSYPVVSERWDATRFVNFEKFYTVSAEAHGVFPRDDMTTEVREKSRYANGRGYKKEPQGLFFKEYANIIELQIGFEGAAANGVEVSAEVTKAIEFATSKVDPTGALKDVYNSICGLYDEQLNKEAQARIERTDTAYDPTIVPGPNSID